MSSAARLLLAVLFLLILHHQLDVRLEHALAELRVGPPVVVRDHCNVPEDAAQPNEVQHLRWRINYSFLKMNKTLNVEPGGLR